MMSGKIGAIPRRSPRKGRASQSASTMLLMPALSPRADNSAAISLRAWSSVSPWASVVSTAICRALNPGHRSLASTPALAAISPMRSSSRWAIVVARSARLRVSEALTPDDAATSPAIIRNNGSPVHFSSRSSRSNSGSAAGDGTDRSFRRDASRAAKMSRRMAVSSISGSTSGSDGSSSDREASERSVAPLPTTVASQPISRWA
jgi:hypothetical protein